MACCLQPKNGDFFNLYSKINPTLAKQEVFICEVTLGQIEVEGRMKYFAEWISKTLNETSPTFSSKGPYINYVDKQGGLPNVYVTT